MSIFSMEVGSKLELQLQKRCLRPSKTVYCNGIAYTLVLPQKTHSSAQSCQTAFYKELNIIGLAKIVTKKVFCEAKYPCI